MSNLLLSSESTVHRILWGEREVGGEEGGAGRGGGEGEEEGGGQSTYMYNIVHTCTIYSVR